MPSGRPENVYSIRNIELNPVRADMVVHPADYPWSSYHFNALGIKNSLLKEHGIYTALGQGAAKCQSAYRALFEHQVPDKNYRGNSSCNQ